MYRVLTLDNSIISSHVLSYFLSKDGFEVDHCFSRSAFAEKLKGFRPHVVICNVDMPQHAIASYCGFLRSASRPGGPKVLLFSDAEERQLIECVEQGFADGYYIKDPQFKGLSETVRLLINQPPSDS